MSYTGDFALVCEGVSDFAVLRNILLGFFKGEHREPSIQQYQPDKDATNENYWQQFGNWELVFKYLTEKKFKEALKYNMYLIVQIDTDDCEHVNFGVQKYKDGIELSPTDLIQSIAGKIKDLIGEEDFQNFGDRIIFAICVHSMECWLLPLWDSQKATKIKGCLNALNASLVRKNLKSITAEDKKSGPYDDASRGYRKKNDLHQLGSQNVSLGYFLEELKKRNIKLPEIA